MAITWFCRQWLIHFCPLICLLWPPLTNSHQDSYTRFLRGLPTSCIFLLQSRLPSPQQCQELKFQSRGVVVTLCSKGCDNPFSTLPLSLKFLHLGYCSQSLPLECLLIHVSSSLEYSAQKKIGGGPYFCIFFVISWNIKMMSSLKCLSQLSHSILTFCMSIFNRKM